LYALLQRRKVVKRAHGRRTIGDGGVGETETARRDRDRASEKYLVVPLMETVPIYMYVCMCVCVTTAAAVRVVFVNRFVQYYYNTDLRCVCVCVCVSVYTTRERCTYRVRVCTGTDCRAGRGEKELRERPMEDRTCACVYLCIMKPVQTNEPGERGGGGVLSSELLYILYYIGITTTAMCSHVYYLYITCTGIKLYDIMYYECIRFLSVSHAV